MSCSAAPISSYAFLQACVAEGVLDEATAGRVDALLCRSVEDVLRETSGLGVPPAPADGAPGYAPLLLEAPVDAAQTLDGFEVDAAQRPTLELVHRFCAPGEREAQMALVLSGASGSGRTHLLSAIVNAQAPGRARLVGALDVDAEVERAIRLRCRAELRSFLSSTEVLAVDDLSRLEEHPVAQQELLGAIELLHRRGGRLVVSLDPARSSRAGFIPGLAERLNGAVEVALPPPGRAVLLALLQRDPSAAGWSEDVRQYLAEQLEGAVARMRSAVLQLAAIEAATGVPIDLDLARAVVPLPADLRPVLPPIVLPEPGPALPDGVPGEVADAQVSRRFKAMLSAADSEEEQALALQIAIGERLRQLEETGVEPDLQARLRRALGLLREGRLEEAMRCLPG
jgi:hypothetical protein